LFRAWTEPSPQKIGEEIDNVQDRQVALICLKDERKAFNCWQTSGTSAGWQTSIDSIAIVKLRFFFTRKNQQEFPLASKLAALSVGWQTSTHLVADHWSLIAGH
jgi:hypothetical protein